MTDSDTVPSCFLILYFQFFSFYFPIFLRVCVCVCVCVCVYEIIVTLTAKEHTLLETLSRNEGRIVSIDALCEALWGDNPFGYENSLNAHIRRIREKIETDPSKPVSLITIKGLGYKLNARK